MLPQSYLWNTAASHRIERFGASVVVAGDLVLPQKAGVRDGGDAGGAPEGAVAGRSFDERSTDRLAAVHVVTIEEAAAGMRDCFAQLFAAPTWMRPPDRLPAGGCASICLIC